MPGLRLVLCALMVVLASAGTIPADPGQKLAWTFDTGG